MKKLKFLLILIGSLIVVACEPQSTELNSQITLTQSNQSLPKIEEKSLKSIEENYTLLEEILPKNNQLTQAQNWQFKALLIKVNENSNPPILNYYYYQSIYEDVNNNQIQERQDRGFFNPASTVKVAISIMTLEKLNNLNLGRETEYRKAGSSQWYSIKDDITKALVISDNSATNRLILFVGFDYLNSRMESLGFNSYEVNRLMLNQGTLVNSPPFELRFQDQIIQQPSQKTSRSAHCFEYQQTIGNCANAQDLAEILITLVQPELSTPEKQFNLREEDRLWLQNVMSKTPKETGFDFENTYCRFLDPLGKKIANQGRLLSKCGIGLFPPYNLVDTSFLLTNEQQKYYLVMVISPPSRITRNDAINWLNNVSELLLKEL